MGRIFVHVHTGDDTAVFVESQHPRKGSGPGGGQFTKGAGGSSAGTVHVHVHQPEAKARSSAAELTGPPEPGKPFLIYRLGQEGTQSLADRNAGNAWGVAEHLANIDDFESAQPSGGTGDHINIYEVTIDKPTGSYLPIIGGTKKGPAEEQNIGYRARPSSRTPPAIAISFGQTGYKHRFLSSFPLSEVRAVLKEQTGYDNFDDSGWAKGGAAISEAVKRHLGGQATRDWDPQKHPRGGRSENKGEFSVSSGGGGTTQVHVHRGEQPTMKPGGQPAPKGGALHIHAPRSVPHPGGETFASPNLHELPHLTASHAILTAQAQLATHRQKLFEQAAADVDHRLGIAPAREAPAIGAWDDGAEGTTIMVAPHATEAQLRLSAAMKGWLGQQKAVLSFTADPKGTATMYQGMARGTPDDVHRALIADGIVNHTLEPAGAGVRIFIADTDGSAAAHVSAYAVHHALKFSTIKGRAEFIGAKHYEGTSDAQQRAEAQGEYEYVIAHSGVAGAGSIPAAELWRGVRDRWAQALLTTKDRRGPVELTYDLQAHVFVEAEHPRHGRGPQGGEFAPKGEGGATGGGAPPGMVHVHVHRPGAPPQTRPARTEAPPPKPALKGSTGHPATISSRFPTAIKGTEKPNEDYLQTGLDAMKLNPEKFGEAMQLFKSPTMYPQFREEELRGKSPDQIAETVIGHMVSNLFYFAQHAPPKTRQWGTAWYREENKKAQAQAKRYGVPLASVAGTYAALSPQKDWNMNVYLGDRVMEALTLPKGAATKWSDRMDKASTWIASQKTATEGMKHLIGAVRGKSLEDLHDPLERAAWVRMWDEGHPPEQQLFKLFRPDGEAGDYGRTDEGKPQKAQWGGFDTIANAIASFESGGDREIISEAMGYQNKVRSFYNNILDPESTNGDITSDTHAIGAALFDALGGSTAAVAHGLGSSLSKKHQPEGYKGAPKPLNTGVAGLYGVYAEAYRRAAKQLGIRPLELQSLTWEAKRALFEHMPAGGRAAVHKAWEDYHDGKGTFEEAREAAVKAAGGFKEPDWTRPLAELTPDERKLLAAGDRAA